MQAALELNQEKVGFFQEGSRGVMESSTGECL